MVAVGRWLVVVMTAVVAVVEVMLVEANGCVPRSIQPTPLATAPTPAVGAAPCSSAIVHAAADARPRAPAPTPSSIHMPRGNDMRGPIHQPLVWGLVLLQLTSTHGP